jgi:hypothetical protein
MALKAGRHYEPPTLQGVGCGHVTLTQPQPELELGGSVPARSGEKRASVKTKTRKSPPLKEDSSGLRGHVTLTHPQPELEGGRIGARAFRISGE